MVTLNLVFKTIDVSNILHVPRSILKNYETLLTKKNDKIYQLNISAQTMYVMTLNVLKYESLQSFFWCFTTK